MRWGDIMDRRQRKSRKAIIDAFNKLLTKKRYSEITVQEIIDEADVSRSTFYAHFETRDELLKEMCTELFDHVVMDHGTAEGTHDFSGTSDDKETIITHILYHIRDDTNNITDILRGESGYIFLGYFKEYLKKTFEFELSAKIRKSEIPSDYILDFIASGFVDTVNWWIHNQKKQTPEEMEKWYFMAMSSVLQ